MKRLSLISLTAAALIIAGCGGGTGGSLPLGNTGSGSGGGSPVTNQAKTSLTFSIRISSSPSSSSSKRTPNYISPGTQSLGVVVTNQGASPSAAQYVNLSNCTTSNGSTTCQVTAAALPGLDTIAITAYSGTSGGGSVLGSGSIQYQVQPGANNVTSPLTINGEVASITLTPALSHLPLGQSAQLSVVAKDAGGNIIVGRYNNAPITLSGTNLAVTPSTVSSSTDIANGIYVSWNNGYNNWGAATVTATTSDNITGTTTLTPASGFALYNAGGNAAYNVTGFKMKLGPDGNIYYSSLSPTTCTGATNNNVLCVANAGAIHQFNPSTLTDTAITLSAAASEISFDANNGLWFGAQSLATVGYLPNATTSFTAANVEAIPLPTPTGITNFKSRQVAFDGSGNAWFFAKDPSYATYLMKTPVANPSASTVTVVATIPPGPAGTPQNLPGPFNIFYANGALYVTDADNGELDAYNISSGTWTQYPSPDNATWFAQGGGFAFLYQSVQLGDTIYVGSFGNDYVVQLPTGSIYAFNTSSNTWGTTYTMPAAVAAMPAAYAVNDNVLYYGDFSGTDVLGYINLADGDVRAIPQGIYGQPGPQIYNDGAAAMSDGTAWFSCYNSSVNPVPPLCIGHTVYLSGWSVWPGTQIPVNGAGTQGEQLIGIMEAPTANSGPFTAVSSNTNVCTTTSVQSHNFNIVGVAAGACSVVVTDAHSVSETISVTVTTTSGTISTRTRKNGGLF